MKNMQSYDKEDALLFIDKRGPGECWPWRLCVNPQWGYGAFKVKDGNGKRLLMAHKIIYELLVGPVPDGKYIRHRCSHKSCCNPAHMVLWGSSGKPIPEELLIESVMPSVSKMTKEETRSALIHKRIMQGVEQVPGGCWIWKGAINSSGYGSFKSVANKESLSHRVMYHLHKGPIPNGLQIDHLCRNRLCCNPDHLEPVTRSVNRQRQIRPPEHNKRDACGKGHEFDDANTYWAKNGTRRCRACGRERMQSYRDDGRYGLGRQVKQLAPSIAH